MPREEHQSRRPVRVKEIPWGAALDVGSRDCRSMTWFLEPALAHREKFFAALVARCAPVEAEQRAQCLVDRRAELFDGLLRRPVCPTQGLGHDMVDHPQ